MAATATATPRVAREIAARLGLREWVSIRSGFDRPNLAFDVVSRGGQGAVARKRAALLHVLGHASRRPALPAIVYCGTRKDTEDVGGDDRRAGDRDRRLPRRHEPGGAPRQPGGVHGGTRRGGGGDERVRHGGGQGGRAHGRALGAADEPRGLLPGGRPRRARRRAGAGAAAGGADGPRAADPVHQRARDERAGREGVTSRACGAAPRAIAGDRPRAARRARTGAAVDRRARGRGGARAGRPRRAARAV